MAYQDPLPPMHFSVAIVGALIGALILLFGRKLFWLCVAAVGFAAGVELAPFITHQPSSLLQLTFAILLGFIGALVALFLQKIAIGLLGFLAGGRLAVGIVATFFVQYTSHYWVTFLIGGIIGALLMLMLFDVALIFISSIVGGHLVTRAVALPPTGATLLLAALVLCGIVIQTATMRRARSAAT